MSYNHLPLGIRIWQSPISNLEKEKPGSNHLPRINGYLHGLYYTLYFANYIPQIIGISVGKTLNKPMIWQYYAARYFNLIGYILIMFLAIWKFRFSKLGATVLALNPMALFLSSLV